MPIPEEVFQPDVVSSVRELEALLLEQTPRPNNELWDGIPPEEAAVARAALLRAQTIRELRADPGDAYLQGLARGLAINRAIQGLGTEEAISLLKLFTGGGGGGEDRQPAA